jgi:hypothetical protein
MDAPTTWFVSDASRIKAARFAFGVTFTTWHMVWKRKTLEKKPMNSGIFRHEDASPQLCMGQDMLVFCVGHSHIQ